MPRILQDNMIAGPSQKDSSLLPPPSKASRFNMYSLTPYFNNNFDKAKPFLFVGGAIVLVVIMLSASIIPNTVFQQTDFTQSPWTNTDFKALNYKFFSQWGSDGILLYILNNLDPPANNLYGGYYVEFGTEDGSECNSRFLREIFGWEGLLMDGSNHNPNLNLQTEFITSLNIVDLLLKYNVPFNPRYISIDVDYDDYWIFQAILKDGRFRPDIFSVEYNRNLEDIRAVDPRDPQRWANNDNYFGASVQAMHHLGKKYGYTVIACDYEGVNLFLVRNDMSKYLQFQNDVQPGARSWSEVRHSCRTAPVHAPQVDMSRKWLFPKPGEYIIDNPLV